LEDKRHDERTGRPDGGREDAQLFYVDTQGKGKRDVNSKESELVSLKKSLAKKKGKAFNLANLSCYKSLRNPSSVQPPIKPTTRKNVFEKLPKPSKHARKQTSIVDKPDNAQFDYDLWDTKEVISEKDKLLEPDVRDYQKDQTKRKPVAAPKHLFIKTSSLPAVDLPNPGISYNPTYSDHQSLLAAANTIELRKIARETKLRKKIGHEMPRRIMERIRLKEQMEGLYDAEPETVEASSGPLSLNPAVTDDYRKPKQKRTREDEVKKARELKQKTTLAKVRLNDVHRIKSLKKELKQAEEKSITRQQKRIESKLRKQFKPNKISSYRFEAPDLALNLTDELAGSLLDMKTDGNLLEDRFKSLQRRNILEPRQRQSAPKNAKKKVFKKEDYRDILIQEGLMQKNY